MAEITETNAPLEQTQVDAKEELAQQMNIALNGGRIPQDQPPIVEIPISSEATPIASEVSATENVPNFSFDTLKEKYSYEKPEDVLAEIDAYRKYKENPVAEVEFENEASKKLYDAIKGGKQKEAYAILAEQDTLEAYTSAEVNKDNAEDIIKLGMKYKYKDLSKPEIDYKFKKQFSIPKEPTQGVEETDEDFAEKKAEWTSIVSDIEMDKIIEAKSYKPELESRKSKLILPDIEAEVDNDYINWKAQQAEIPKIVAEVEEAYKPFTPKAIETKMNFTDEPNKIAFEYQYEPTQEEFAKAVQLAKSPEAFYNHFKNQDGTPDRQRFLKAISFAINHENALIEAMKQAKNATIKSSIPNTNGAIVRQLAQGQTMSELDENMKRAGVVR